jgi:hypothetical protein
VPSRNYVYTIDFVVLITMSYNFGPGKFGRTHHKTLEEKKEVICPVTDELEKRRALQILRIYATLLNEAPVPVSQASTHNSQIPKWWEKNEKFQETNELELTSIMS